MYVHDWKFHLLTSVFNKYTYDEEYALFFTNHEITIVNKMWENIDVPPFVEAAEIVASWVNLQRELNLWIVFVCLCAPLVGGAQTPSHERLVMITKRKKIKIEKSARVSKRKMIEIMNQAVINLMIENDELKKQIKKYENLLDVTLIKSGSTTEEQSY